MTASPESGDGTARPDSTPTVSIVLPTLNERAYIRDCLDSLLLQDYENILEILLVDGGSSDGTALIAAAGNDLVRVVPNPRVTAAAAMNIGIAAAAGEIIVRVDAHSLYERDFVSRSVTVLLSSGASVVGGPMRALGTTSFGRAVAAVTSSPIGIGPGRFHFADEAQEVDTVYLGAYRPETVTSVGGYDEVDLQWAAEDQELNYRIREAGGRIWLDPTIRSVYFPRSTPRALWRQYFNYGLCKASTLKKHRTLPYRRPLVPAVMVASSVLWSIVALGRRRAVVAAVPVAAYSVGAGIAAVRLSSDPGVTPHRCFGALAICHWGYGLGFWAGVGRILRGRAFDSHPGGHR